MSAYLLASIEVTDPVGYDEYKRGVSATIATYGGSYLVRGGAIETLEGDWQAKRTVLLEFPSFEQLKRWYESPEYQPLRAIRERCARSTLIAMEGVIVGQ